MTEQEKQRILDEDHLKLLRIGYFVGGGVDAFFALFPLIYVLSGIIVAVGVPASTRPGEPSPALLGLIVVFIGLAVSLLFLAPAVLKFLAARALGLPRNRVLGGAAVVFGWLQMPWVI